MKQTLVLIIILTLIIGWTLESEIKWIRSLEEGFENQKATGKDIIIYFGASWCAPCKIIEQKIFSTERFIDYSKRFEMVKIYDDFKKDENAKHDYYVSTMKKFKVDAIPTFVIIKSVLNP